MGERYYFHGDVVADDDRNVMAQRARNTYPGQRIVFCANCDWFGTEEHIRACVKRRLERRGMRMVERIEAPEDRFARDKRWYKSAPKTWRAKWERPSAAVNVFDQ